MAPSTPNSSSETSKRRSKSSRGGVTLPVSRIQKYVRSRSFTRRVATKAALYLTAVIEYLICEIFELSADVVFDHKKVRISPRHILLAVRQDEELDKLFHRVTMANTGVLPMIQKRLLATPMSTIVKPKHTSNSEPSQEY